MFSTREEAAAYVGGIIDGEGCVDVEVKRRSVRVVNTDLGIIEAYEKALEQLGVQYTRRTRPPADRLQLLYIVSIYGRRNLETIARDVPLFSSKRQRIDEVVGSFRMTNYYRKHEITRALLVPLVERGLTHRQIAAELGMTCHGAAQPHLEKHGLLTHRAQQRRLRSDLRGDL